MKKIIFFLVSLLIVQFGYSQRFNTIQHIKEYQTIEIEKSIAQQVLTTPLMDVEIKVNEFTENTSGKVEQENILNLLSANLPLSNMSLTSGFGIRTHPVTGAKNSFHSGVDLTASADTVYSILHGVVIGSGYNRLLGNYVRIKHGNYESIAGHLSTRFVLKNDVVPVGSPIGITGKTGRVTGEHLHFTIKHHDKYINPLQFLTSILTLKGQDLLAVFGW